MFAGAKIEKISNELFVWWIHNQIVYLYHTLILLTMAFPEKLKTDVLEYIEKHHPNRRWWEQYFDKPFISDSTLAVKLVDEMMSIRSIYQFLEGLREPTLIRAQAKFQIITYASVYEAVLHHLIFNTRLNTEDAVKKILCFETYVKRCLPSPFKDIKHNGEEIYTVAKVPKIKDERYVKFDDILTAAKELKLINHEMYDDLLALFSQRNAIHLQAEIAKGIQYEIKLSKKAHELLKPFKRQLVAGLKLHNIIPRTYNVRFTRKEIVEP